MRGRPKATLVLTEAEREELLALARRRKTAQDRARPRKPQRCGRASCWRVLTGWRTLPWPSNWA